METDFESSMRRSLNEISMASQTIDSDQVNRVVKLICDPQFEHIVGFGAGRMGYSLRAFIMRLSHIGFTSYMIGDTNFPKINNHTLVLINSSSGETPTSVLYAEQAHSAGAVIASVTQDAQSSVAKLSKEIITYDDIKSSQIMKTLPEQLSFVLFDVMSEMVIQQLVGDKEIISQNHSISE